VRGRTALVTGSTDGLGLAMAEGLAAAGCDLVLHGLEAEAGMAARCRDLAGRHGVAVRYVRADLAEADGADRLIDAAGVPDVLVNNAVVRHFGPLETLPLAHWQQALNVNLTAVLRAVQLSLPRMRERGWGRIVNLTSAYGSRAVANRVDYVTTKTALLGLTRAIAVETLGQGITCNALCPGSVLTPNIEGRLQALMAERGLARDAATREFLAGKQATGRFVDARHVADLLVYLCSESAVSITGASLPVDDGWMAG
jgi:3-hydroxybutyrate dehydrogenase